MWFRTRPNLTAAALGLGGVAIITLLFVVIPNDAPSEISALLLLLPITVASVLSSWRTGLPIALVAAIAHALIFIPPIGSVQLGYTQDVLNMVTFSTVAVLVSVLVSRRSIKSRAELIGHERMLLLRSVAHDVRSPLNVILSASTELLDGADHEQATRTKLLQLVVDETQRLDRVVDNMLNLSRLQAGALTPSLERISLHDLLAQSRDRFAMLERFPEQIRLAAPVPDVEVLVDPVQIDQVLANLLENAIRHSPASGPVTLRTRASDGAVELIVDDDGPGFSSSARSMLFAPFHSTDGSSGLGLTVCKAIIDAHHGTITVRDRPGGGTSVCFTVRRAL